MKFNEFLKFKRKKFSHLTLIDDFNDITSISNKAWFQCDCGDRIYVNIRRVVNKKRTSCGHCSCYKFKLKGQIQFGNLKLITPLKDVKKFSQKVDVICKCGNQIKVFYRNLAINNTQSCGKCALFLFKKKRKKHFNSLTLLDPIELISSLSQIAKFKCKCGSISKHKLYNVIYGHTKHCGQCYHSIHQSFTHSDVNYDYPIKPGLLFNRIYHSNTILNSNTRLHSFCPICEKPWNPIFKDIYRGASLTCGCSYNRVSTQQKEIGQFLSSFGLQIEFEKEIGGLKYDIVVPSHKLCIEFHGLKWHTGLISKKRDIQKYRNAIQNGIKLVTIYEDEWKNKSNQVRDLLLTKLGIRKSNKLRPSKCKTQFINNQEINSFYDSYHYFCLLYTSPSPRDRTRSRMPSSA